MPLILYQMLRKGIRCFIILFILALEILPFQVVAQAFQVSAISDKNADSLNVRDVYEDALGFVWLTTEHGLVQYNGKQFTVKQSGEFQKFIHLSPRLALAVGPKHIVALAPGQKPDSVKFIGLIRNKITIGNIVDVVATENDTYWFLLRDGISVMKHGVLASIPIEGFRGNYERCKLIARQEVVLLVTPDGVTYHWDGVNDDIIPVPSGTFQQIQDYINYNDSISFLLDEDRVIKTDGKGSIEDNFNSLPYGLHATDLENFEDKILLGSQDGLFVGKSSVSGFLFNRIFNGNEPHRLLDLPFKNVSKIHYSVNKNIWVLSNGQLWLLNQRPFSRLSYDLPMATFKQIVFLDNGKIYLDSDNGIFECVKTEHGYDVSSLNLSKRQSTIAGYGNRLWISTVDYKIHYYEDGKYFEAADLSKRGAIIFSLYPDNNQHVWVLQAPALKPITGLLKLSHDGKITDYDQRRGFQSRMLAVRQSSDGTIYCAGIGPDSYLYRYDSITDQFINLSVKLNFSFDPNFEVHDLSISADNTIWLASTAGLLEYKDGTIRKVYSKDLHEQEAIGVAAAPNGDVWFSTESRGAARYSNGEFTFFDLKAGLATNLMTYRSIRYEHDGTVFLGSREGYFFSSPEFRQLPNTKSPVLLSITNQKPENLDGSFPFNSILKFDFVSLSHPVTSIQYAYKISALDDRWIDLLPNDSLVLSNLRDGQYSIQIRARQYGGYKWSDPMRYSFTIQKIWYRQSWMLLVYAGCAGMFIFAIFRWYNLRLLREREILEMKVAQRTIEIAQKNGEISAQMNEIAVHMNELREMNKELATETEKSVRQTKLIEKQNYLLEAAKSRLEDKVNERTHELSLSNQELIEHNIQLEQFAFMTAHNLRAPVARLLGLSSIFNKTDANDPLNREIIQKMEESTHNLDEIIRDISMILQIKKSTGAIFQTIKVLDVLHKMINSFNTEIRNKNIKIVNSISDNLVVYGIEPYLTSVFYNALSNSIKYADVRKLPAINITSELQEEQVIITFSDNGVGFDEAHHREKLFKPFSRLNSITEGKGLGLYLMKIEMESMHGSIEIHSEPDVGTNVTLAFHRKGEEALATT